MPQEPIGKILHFWPRVGAAQLELDESPVHVGDKIRIRGHGHDFIQPVESLEIDHQAKSEGWPGEHVAVEVVQPVHEGDEVFLIKDR
ncbi:MAG: hypothetical protein WDA16_05485 [Candidatus Thermoplasmatota archaeon]